MLNLKAKLEAAAKVTNVVSAQVCAVAIAKIDATVKVRALLPPCSAWLALTTAQIYADAQVQLDAQVEASADVRSTQSSLCDACSPVVQLVVKLKAAIAANAHAEVIALLKALLDARIKLQALLKLTVGSVHSSCTAAIVDIDASIALCVSLTARCVRPLLSCAGR